MRDFASFPYLFWFSVLSPCFGVLMFVSFATVLQLHADARENVTAFIMYLSWRVESQTEVNWINCIKEWHLKFCVGMGVRALQTYVVTQEHIIKPCISTTLTALQEASCCFKSNIYNLLSVRVVKMIRLIVLYIITRIVFHDYTWLKSIKYLVKVSNIKAKTRNNFWII